MELEKEISRRRTFAIISHPDAGKTTLTEKFLLFGGAIVTAGVRRRAQKVLPCLQGGFENVFCINHALNIRVFPINGM